MSIKFKFKDGITIETIGKSNSTLDELKQEAIKLHKQILEDKIPEISENPDNKYVGYVERYLYYEGYDSALNEQETDALLDKLSEELEDDSYENIGKELKKYLKNTALNHKVQFLGMDSEFDQNQIKNSGFTCESKTLPDMIDYLKEIKAIPSDELTDLSKYTKENGVFDYDKGVVNIYSNDIGFDEVEENASEPVEGEKEVAKETTKKSTKSSGNGLSKYAYGYKSRPNNLINYLIKKVKSSGAYSSLDELVEDVKKQFMDYTGEDNNVFEVRKFFEGKEDKLNEWIKTTVIKHAKKKAPDLVLFEGDSIGDESLLLSYDKLKEMLDNGKDVEIGYTVEEGVEDTFDDGGHYGDTSYNAFKEDDQYKLSRTNWSEDGGEGSTVIYEFDSFDELKDEIEAIKFELKIVKDANCKDFFEPISSFKSFEFLDKTKQGFEVIKTFKDLDDDRMHVIANRPEDNTYIICLGYSPETGSWNQGRYDYKSYKSAEKDLKKDYNVAEFEYEDKVEVEDADEEIVIKKDSQEEDKDLTFRRGR